MSIAYKLLSWTAGHDTNNMTIMRLFFPDLKEKKKKYNKKCIE
jgi:hypothetical protein